MKRLAFASLLFLTIFFLACKKDSVIADVYPVTYHKFTIKPAAPLRLFTLKGEVTNPSTLYWFYFYKTADTALYNIATSYIVTNYFMDTVKFTDAQTVILPNQFFQNDSCTANLQTTELILTSKDTSKIYSGQDVFTPDIYQNIGKIKPAIFLSSFFLQQAGNMFLSILFTKNMYSKKQETG